MTAEVGAFLEGGMVFLPQMKARVLKGLGGVLALGGKSKTRCVWRKKVEDA
ncbi:hypothetical protein L6R29_10435 [Myxococcota bacterium]|nr:hypothetical protein [Myxococcota bacterium]